MAVTYLETQKFTAAIEAFKTGAESYKEIKNGVDTATTALLKSWEGEGRNQFEKDYRFIFRQLSDIEDLLYELYNSLIEAQSNYIKTDDAVAKELTP